MKKSLIVASLLALGATSASAESVKQYVGIGIGANWAKVKASAKGNIEGDVINESASETRSSLLAKAKTGAIYDDTHRFSIAYTPVFNKYANVHSFLGEYDFLVSLNDANRIYAGAHVGVAKFKGKKGLVDDVKKTGLAYGAQLGYITDITDNIELELGAMYTQYNVDKSYSASSGADWIRVKGELKSSTSLFVGINRKF